MSTGFFCAEMADIQPEGMYVVIGCGAVGLLAITAGLRLGACNIVAVDPAESRLGIAEELGATSFSDSDDAVEFVLEATAGRGAEGVMELVGLPAAAAHAVRDVTAGTISVS